MNTKPDKSINKYFAPCPRGLEESLLKELEKIGASEIRKDDGGVHFSGDMSTCYKANLFSRTASRVYWKIGSSDYLNEKDIYDFAYSLKWEEWFDTAKTFRVTMVGKKCPLKSLNFAGLKIKDAVCDRFRNREGIRPNVNPNAPDMRIHGFITENQIVISLDTSGDALFKRGYREKKNIAPIRENLAAGIIYLSGWQPGMPFLDPMCGSGTFLVEVARMSLNIASGIARSFAFEKMINFEKKLWADILSEAIENEKDTTELPIFGSDISSDAIADATVNLQNAGLYDSVKLQCVDIRNLSTVLDKGTIIANLPYGERIGEKEQLRELYPEIGDVLKKKFAGWNAYFVTADLEMPKFIRLSVSKRIPIFNGPLECRIFEYKIISGSNRK